MRTETVRKIAKLLKSQQQFFPNFGSWRAMVHEMADIIQEDFDGWPCRPEFLAAINEGSEYEHPKV